MIDRECLELKLTLMRCASRTFTMREKHLTNTEAFTEAVKARDKTLADLRAYVEARESREIREPVQMRLEV